MNIVVVSGGFDPIHSGHISYMKAAKDIGDHLIVALNSDEWLIEKKKKVFMNIEERKNILLNIECVDEVIIFNDDDSGSCIDALEKIKNKYPNEKIIFCNGGDRDKDNIPEMMIEGIEFRFGIGGDEKKNSSSSLLKNWKYDSEERIWGSFYNFYDSREVKVKELIVNPRNGMSFQKHKHRNEIWVVIKALVKLYLQIKIQTKKKKLL